ncbi:unnamed protein product [Prunus armeniaca]|uniref:DUF295 domain-containing protein n=1 Tax=Prunus armeniaca TaxID=36596 RepID=A0A6J5Y0U9_PRUAR|nr:unnamed protein product [Prunus armeniaca]
MERRLRVMGIPEGAVAGDTDTNSKSLYICTYKCNSRSFHARYDISAIGLSDLSSILKSKSQLKIDKLELLRKLASVEGKDVPYDTGCCLFGSQILLAGGRKPEDLEQDDTSLYELDAGTQIYLFEADDNEKTKAKVYNHGNRFGSFPPPHSHSHSHGGGIIKGGCCYGELHQGKPQPLVVEVAGKLFVLSSGPVDFPSPAFEEFNSNKGIWTTLPDPPPYTGDCRDFSYAIVGTKIMVSTPISSVFCFDADAPNPGQWSVCCAEPFPFEGKALVLDLEEDDNRNKIVFGYERIPGHGYDVVAYTMFNDDENGYCYCHRITPLHLLTEFSELVFGTDNTFSFVHLGGGKVCFVIAYSMASLEGDDDYPILGEEEVDLIVVTFEFSISKKDGNSTRFFSTKTLGSCIFPFDFASESGSVFEAKLLGCFVR